MNGADREASVHIDFHDSDHSTVGIEVEYALVDTTTWDLANYASVVLDAMGQGHPDGVHPKAKQELYQSTVEVITGINETIAEAKADLAATVAEVDGQLAGSGVTLTCSGVHPFGRWYELKLSESERYTDLIESIQWPARRLMTNGVHFHVGVQSGEKAIAITNALVWYLPHFVAVSASSPFWHGHDTGLASVRTKIFESMPTTGLPPHLDDWSDFERFMQTLIAAGSIKSVREVWWDIRPHPNFGTVELRMCDGIPTLFEVAALGALAQCLVTWMSERIDRGERLPFPRDWIARENKWRAARYGIDASIVVDETGRCEPLRDSLADLVAELLPTARRLGCADELGSLLDIVRVGPSNVRQRRIVAEGGDLRDVVRSLSRELTADRPDA